MKRINLLIVIALTMIGVFAFENCSQLGSNSRSTLSSQSASILNLDPPAITVAPSSTLTFAANGGLASSYRFSVIGAGSIDQQSGTYTAPSTLNDDVVQVIDSTGAKAFAFVKVAKSDSALAVYPAALQIQAGQTFKFIGLGGTPPYTFSIGPTQVGRVDGTSGVFTALNSGSVALTVTDSSNQSVSANIQVQATSLPLAAMYVPNPLQVGQTAIIYANSPFNGLSSMGLSLKSGPGSVTGLTYSPGYSFGPAILNLNYLDTTPQVLSIAIPLANSASNPNVCVHGKRIFTYTGSDQTFNVPTNCASITMKLWGGGGAGDGGYPGGGGGFVTGQLVATETKSLPAALTIIVGAGGNWHTDPKGVYGGGGPTVNLGVYGHWGWTTGAGRSAIRIGTTEILTAGGGGGGTGWAAVQYPNINDNYGVAQYGCGGAGGGLIGEDGLCGHANGGGGTQTVGGSGQSGAGQQFVGGQSWIGIGSGGGGYYGGAAGGVWGQLVDGGGGGGSSYFGGSNDHSIVAGSTIGGHGSQPGNTLDLDYIPGIAIGSGTDPSILPLTAQPLSIEQMTFLPVGGNGLVVIQW